MIDTPETNLRTCALGFEDLLLERLAAEQAARRAGERALSAVTLVVVRDAALREHVLGRLLGDERFCGACVGIEVRTLAMVARGVLERAGEAAPAGRRRLALLARRRARTAAELERLLAALDEGSSTLLPALERLTGAGLCAATAGAVLERIEDDEQPLGSEAERGRLRALVRILVELEADGERGIAPAHLAAAEALGEDADLLPAERVVAYRLERAGGQENALVAELLRRGAEWIGPEPVGAGARGALEFAAGGREPAAPHPAAAPERFAAAAFDPHAEAELAVRFLERQAEEHKLEFGPRLGLVVFGSERYARPLRRAFERAGVPFSAVGIAGPLSPTGRDLAGLAALLRTAERTPTAAWIELQQGASSKSELDDLAVACCALGLGRLGALAEVDLERVLDGQDSYALPVRLGGASPQGLGGNDGEDDGEGPPSAAEDDELEPPAAGEQDPRAEQRRRVTKQQLAGLVERGRHSLRLFETVPDEQRDLQQLSDAVRELAAGALGWEPRGASMAALEAALGSLSGEFAGLELSFEEWADQLAAELERRAAERLGGRGAGVRVLPAQLALGQVFDCLAVIGLDRSGLGAGGSGDPFLSDLAAEGLAEVLPDLTPARERPDERAAQLDEALGGARHAVALLCARHDLDDRPQAIAPLFERRSAGARAIELDWEHLPRTPLEHGLEWAGADAGAGAGSAGGRSALDGLRGLFELGFEHRRAGSPVAAPELAAARLDVLQALDELPERAAARGVGPFGGRVGPLLPDDPRREPLYVTTLEALARCGWQAFLTRVLRIESLPDPLAGLPLLDPRLCGNVVHDSLERLAGAPGLARELRDAHTQAPHAPQRPRPQARRKIVLDVARAQARDAGWNLPGMARLLMEACDPVVEKAVELIWAEGPPNVVGVELQGSLPVADAAGESRELRFRADRVDRDAEGRLTLIDYKTGKPVSDAKTDPARQRHLRKAVREGTRLQATAYALAAGEGARGAYLSLKVRGGAIADEHRCEGVGDGGAELKEDFEHAAGVALTAFEQGAFVPRLFDQDATNEPLACGRCEVAEACVRGDSGARARLTAWAEGAREHAPDGALERAWIALLDIAEEAPK